MKKKSASISGAIFDASGGKSGKLVIHFDDELPEHWADVTHGLSVPLCVAVSFLPASGGLRGVRLCETSSA